MAGISVGELFVELFFKADQVRLKDFIASVGELNMASIASSLGLGALYTGLEKIMTVSAETAVEVNKFTAITGISGEKMQAFDNAAKNAGLAAGTFSSAVVNLQNKITDMKLTGAGSSFLSSFLGINPYEDRDAIDTLEKTINRIKETVKPEMRGWAMGQLGLDASLLAVDFTKIRQEVVQSADETARMMEYVKAMNELSISIKKVWYDIAGIMAPLIARSAEDILEIRDKYKKEGFFSGTGKLITDALMNFTPAGVGAQILAQNLAAPQNTIHNTFHVVGEDTKTAVKATWEEMERHGYDVANYQSQVRR